MHIKKAVFPVAGLGTRLLPVTKVSPKEMLPVVDKPLIQYAVEEAVLAGITEIIFVTSHSKHVIEEHFHEDLGFEQHLREQGKARLAALLHDITPPNINFTYVFQDHPLGLGNAVLCAEEAVGLEPFAVVLPDVLIAKHSPCLDKMCRRFTTQHRTIIAVNPVAWSEVSQYGIANLAKDGRIESIVEKPQAQDAPSNLAVLGRYVFSPQIFDCLKQVTMDEHGEIQLTDGIARLISLNDVYAFEFAGKLFDCGCKLGYLQAIVEFGLQHPEISQEFKAYLINMISSHPLMNG